MDQALWSAPGAAPGDEVALAAGTYVRLGVLPFDHERQLVSVLVTDPAGKPLLITKGAPEVILDRCVSVPDAARTALEALFSAGARVVAVAARPAQGLDTLTAKDEQGLTLDRVPDLRGPPQRPTPVPPSPSSNGWESR